MTSQNDPIGTIPAASQPSQRPPRAWRTLFLLLLLLAVGMAMLFVGHRYGDHILRTAGEFWRDLAGEPAGEGKTSEHDQFYTCGMHPWVILPKPGLCPICHMDLTPLDPGKFTGQISIDPVLAQNIGVRVGTVESGPLVQTVRTLGKVDYDETTIADVNLKVAGWIETLHVDYLGAEVKEGDPLFELYSPELFSAQQEYLLACGQTGQPEVPFVTRIAEDARSQMLAARTRLSYFGIDDAQIEELERKGQPLKSMTIKSPATGMVIKKMAVAGMRVDPGMQMYRIADLRKVWVMVTIYEYQLPFVELGQEAAMSLSYIPGQQFHGRVSFVYPWTDEKTRQVNVRLEFENQLGLLKPGMFANVELRRTLAIERTLVSRSAVLDTGERQVAFVSLGNGRFEPRNLRLGVETDKGMVEVLDGLKPGEEVVTSAQFLLDSESKIREGLLRMIRGNLAGAPEAGTESAPELAVLPPALGEALVEVLDGYLRIAGDLAGDSATGLSGPARRIAQGVEAMLAVDVPGQEHFWTEHEEVATIRGKALELLEVGDLAGARLTFTDLSVALAKLLRTTGVPRQHGHQVEELHCPMYLENQGGSVWLQDAGQVRNPYFGARMLGCFDRRQVLPVAGVGERAAGSLPGFDIGAIDALVAAYLEASAALAGDRIAGLPDQWRELKDRAGQLMTDSPGLVAELASTVRAAVPAGDLNLASAREAFAPLSAAVIELVRAQPPQVVLERAFCPMVEASWLQVGKQLRNPYMGSDMLECGSIEETMPARSAGGQGR